MPRKKSEAQPMKAILVRVPQDLYELIAEEARADERSLAKYVARILEAHLRHKPKPKR
jgi:predicted HicB family RNase H-like nuclease